MLEYNVIVAGSRNFNDYELLKRKLDILFCRINSIYEICIVSGTAKGADSLGERYAKENNLKLKKYPADWDKHGKSAGYKRNTEMAKIANASVIFWDKKSKGSKHMIDISINSKLQLRVYDFNGDLIKF